jgi:ATP-dependent DNA helicase RecG
MTPNELFGEHASKPGNPDVATAFFRSGYVEAWGRGVYKMVKECEDAGLPIPTLKYESQDFKAVFRKDIYNEEYLKTLDLSDRQIKAVLSAKQSGKITNKNYQELCGVSKPTASRDIKILIDKNVLFSNGKRGAGAFYTTR